MPDQTDAGAGGETTSTLTVDDKKIEVPQRPEGVPEQFWDREKGAIKGDAAVKAYLDTQAAYTKAQQQIKTLQGEEGGGLRIPAADTAGAAMASDDATIDTVLEAAGLTREQVAASWVENDGKLTDEQYAALREKAKLGRRLVDSTIGTMIGRAAQQIQAAQASCTELAGGEKQLANLLEFGKTLPPADQAFFNGLGKRPETMVQAVEWLLAKHTTAVGAGKAQPLVGGDGAGSAGAGAFKTQGELMAAQGDPRWNRDPEYTKQVRARIAATGNIRNLPRR